MDNVHNWAPPIQRRVIHIRLDGARYVYHPRKIRVAVQVIAVGGVGVPVIDVGRVIILVFPTNAAYLAVRKLFWEQVLQPEDLVLSPRFPPRASESVKGKNAMFLIRDRS